MNSKHTRVIKICYLKKAAGIDLSNKKVRKQEIYWQYEMQQDLIPTLTSFFALCFIYAAKVGINVAAYLETLTSHRLISSVV